MAAGKGLYQFKIETYQGTPCLAVWLGGEEAMIPLHDIVSASQWHSEEAMEIAAQAGIPRASDKAATAEKETDLAEVLADIARRLRKLESVFTFQGLDDLSIQIGQRIVEKLRNQIGGKF